MKGHNIFVREVIQLRMHFLFQLFQFRTILQRILAVGIRMIRVCLTKFRSNGLYLRNRIRNRHPYMRIIFSIISNKGNVRIIGCLNHFQLLLLECFIQKRFHASAINNKYIGLFQRFHIFCSQLIIVQAARLRLCHIDHLNPINALRDIENINIHRIKGSHNRKVFSLSTLLLAPTAGGQQQAKQPDSQYGQNFFQCVILHTDKNISHLSFYQKCQVSCITNSTDESLTLPRPRKSRKFHKKRTSCSRKPFLNQKQSAENNQRLMCFNALAGINIKCLNRAICVCGNLILHSHCFKN